MITPTKKEGITKRLAFDDESANKLQKKPSLFDQFSSNASVNTHKRKPVMKNFDCEKLILY